MWTTLEASVAGGLALSSFSHVQGPLQQRNYLLQLNSRVCGRHSLHCVAQQHLPRGRCQTLSALSWTDVKVDSFVGSHGLTGKYHGATNFRNNLRVLSSSSPEQSNATSNEPGDDLPEYSFRKAKKADMPIVWAMVISEYMNPLGLNMERTVVVDGGEGLGLLGAGQIKVMQNDPPVREVGSLVVQPKFRGQGIGTRLLCHLLDSIAGTGQVHLLTIGRAIPFYERVGFREIPAEQVPECMRAELAIGGIVARLAAQDRCLCMACEV